MSNLLKPGESVNYVGGVPMNREVKSAFAQLTASFLGMGRERGDLKGLSKNEINMLEQSVQADMAVQKPDTTKFCAQCGRRGVVPGTSYCPDHL